MKRAEQWIADHPEDCALIRRCYEACDDRSGATPTPEDRVALSAWVTRTVMNAPVISFLWEDWPPCFGHEHPHRDLADFYPR